MPGDYAVLAPIYDTIGLSDFSRVIVRRVINFAQQNDWMGRRILELGCGTGMAANWLCETGFNVIGVDQSAEMLEMANTNLAERSRLLFKRYQQDIRTLGAMDATDMALALDVMNEMESLRDLERAFASIHKALPSGKLLVFDMRTIEGLTQDGESPEKLAYNDDNLTVFTRNEYDYERQLHTRHYLIFHQNGTAWQRQEATQVLRAYPIQGVATLVQRTGFNITAVLNLNFEPFDPATSRAARVVFVAQKV
jgi:SAM-dependent methyltransferase